MPARRSPRAASLTVLFGLVLAPLLTGCGDSGPKPPPLGTVTGIVKMDGQPLKNAAITFIPDTTRPSVARSDENGRYELMFNDKLKGAAIGKHKVTISMRDAQPEKGNRETVPAKYNDKSELTAEVKAGTNEINFDNLTSK